MQFDGERTHQKFVPHKTHKCLGELRGGPMDLVKLLRIGHAFFMRVGEVMVE